MTLSRAPILLGVLLHFTAHANEVTETFSSRANFVSGTAIWNHALGKVHPTLQTVDYDAGASPPIGIDVGNGSHGAFDISTYAQFSVNGDISGNKIRFDTNAYPILKVTSFHLAQGWVLEPVGSNPLIIYSLSDIRIEGEIWCQGRDGEDGDGTTPGLGGTGRCGGMNGGNGGSINQPGVDGFDADTLVTGGQGGNASGVGVSGGGGGSWNDDPVLIATASSNATGTGGNFGSSLGNPDFSNLAGGAGGGGGAGTAAVAGAGGGGGGGTVILHAVGDINIGETPSSLYGFIFANGGKGGSSTAGGVPAAGGAGGGGGGGGIKIFSGGTINLYSNSGDEASQAKRGDSGSNTTSTGGLGGTGRSWLSSVGYNGVGFYAPAEQIPFDPGRVEFVGTQQSVTSGVIDLANSYVDLNSASLSPASSDYTIEVAGSNDSFVNDDTGWTTNLTLLYRKRFLKFRILITASNVNTPDMVDTAVIDYTPGNRGDFAMKAAGCGRIDSASPLNIWPLFLFLVILIGLKFKAEKQKSFSA